MTVPETGVGIGEPPTQFDLALAEGRKRFTLEKQVDLLQETAQRVVGQISLIGSLLAAVGLVSANVVANPAASTWLYAAVGVSLLAVLFALATQMTRPSKLQAGNLLAVKEWFDRYTGWRMWFVAIATWMLVAAFILAMVAAVVFVLSPPSAPSLSGSLTITQATEETPETSTAKGELKVMSAEPDQTATITILANEDVVASALQAPAVDGWITVAATAEGIPTESAVEISATTANWTCTMTLGANGPASDSECTESTPEEATR